MHSWRLDPKQGPLYIQLAERIIEHLLGERISPGDKLASARELSATVGLNPNTVIQAFQELERTGITESRRGKGTFIRDELDLTSLRNQRLGAMIDDFLLKVEALGVKGHEALRLMEERLSSHDS